MKKYTCSDTRPIICEDQSSAASIAAGRIARRIFGKSARVGALRCDSWASDGSSATYEAFVGRKCADGITGKNVWFTLYAPKVEVK